jgi:hypothetical protein
MTYEEKLTVLKRKNSEINKLQTDVREISSTLFDDFRNHIFEKYSTLESFGWTQYTPYFNDGESCHFYANTDYLKINDEWVDDTNWISKTNIISWGEWDRDKREHIGRVEEENPNFNEELSNACQEISDFLSNFDNDFYLSKFGDHAEITITKNSVDISDCDHD